MLNMKKKPAAVYSELAPESAPGRYVYRIKIDRDRVTDEDDVINLDRMPFDTFRLAQDVANTATAWILKKYPTGYVGEKPIAVRLVGTDTLMAVVGYQSGYNGKMPTFDFTEGEGEVHYDWLVEKTLSTAIVKRGAIKAFLTKLQRHYDSLPGPHYRIKPVSLRHLTGQPKK